jgi:hypothetical protein
MMTGLDHQAETDTAATPSDSCERACKLIARLGDRSNSNEARLVLPAVNKALDAAQWDWHDVADAVRKQMEADGKTRKPLGWLDLSAAAQGRWLMKLAKAEFLSAEELLGVCALADRHCLVPGRDADHAPMMDDLLKRWRAKYGEA